MLSMSAQLEIYEQMRLLSTRMVEAARAGDWDRLIDLEHAVSGLRQTLMQERDDAPADRQASARKRELIQHILHDDAEVRRHTEPWMEQVRRFLSGHLRQRQLDRAYGSER